MPIVTLADTTIRTLAAPEKGTIDYWDAKLPSFGCRVSQSGTKTFVLKLHNARRAIGRYPIISLADARVEAKRMLAEKTLGKRRPQSISFESALELFLAEKSKERRARTVSGYKRLLEIHFPFKGQLTAITYQDFRRKLDRIHAQSERNHALAAARTFFRWALRHRYIAEDPTIAFSFVSRPSRSRILTDDELKRVWMAAGEVGGSFGTIVKLLILTGQRRGEVAALQKTWTDLTNKTITLPAEITKNRREHTLPLSALGIELLAAVKSEPPLLFLARGTKDRAFSGWSKGKAELDEISGVADWTLHDIRRTVASNLAALGVQLPIIEKLLNHVSGSFGGIVAVYQRHSFMPEMRAAVEKWDQRVLDILAS